MVLNEQGNCRGEAFVDMATVDDAIEALKCYKLKLLHRFVRHAITELDQIRADMVGSLCCRVSR